jgi:hypothetical protein
MVFANRVLVYKRHVNSNRLKGTLSLKKVKMLHHIYVCPGGGGEGGVIRLHFFEIYEIGEKKQLLSLMG